MTEYFGDNLEYNFNSLKSIPIEKSGKKISLQKNFLIWKIK
jgi:hypothetical protein